MAKFQGPDPLKRLVEDKLKKDVNVDVREEILQNLTGRYVNIQWMQRPIKINSGAQAYAFELKDSAKAKVTISNIRERKPDRFGVETIAGNVVYARPTRENRVPKGMRVPEPCFTIVGNWVIGSDSKKLIERILLANAGSIDGLIGVPEYDLVSSELGGKLDGEKTVHGFVRSLVRVHPFHARDDQVR